MRLSAQCPDGTPPPCGVAAVAPHASVAVLYFVSLSHDSADAYLGEGLTEEIATSLGRIARLRVTGSGAVRRAQQRMRGDFGGIGRALRVRYLVDGTVQPAGDRLRVHVQLVSAASGTQQWSNSYTRPLTDILGVQEEIARDVAANVAGTLLPSERLVLAARPTRDPQAYDHYLQGNFYLTRRTGPTFQRAVTEYQAALRYDPLFTRARARLAYADALALDWGWTLPGVSAEELLVRGLAAADSAIAADPASSDAWMARSYLLMKLNPATFEGVTEAFARAVALDSTNAEAWHQYGSALGLVGADSAATIAFRRALALDPGRAITWMELSELPTMAGDARAGLLLLDSAVASDPDNGIYPMRRAEQRLLLGDTAGARSDAELAVRLDPSNERARDNVVARILTAAGATARARATLAPLLDWISQQLVRLEPRMHGYGAVNPDPVRSTLPALLAVGERELALHYLESLPQRGVGFWYYLHWPTCDPLRGDPRFQALVSATRPPSAEHN